MIGEVHVPSRPGGREEGMVINWTCSAVEYHNSLV